jgi:phage terminase large subunit
MWVEKEYYYDPKSKGRQQVNSEFAKDVQEFLEPYNVRNIYLDPSAEAFQLELQKLGMHIVHANNDVENGIQMMTSEMKKGNLYVCAECTNTIREIESYVWDPKAAQQGYDEPLKKDDHAVDALRYVIASHKIAKGRTDGGHDPVDWSTNKYAPTRRF